jgi:hypothetical protein
MWEPRLSERASLRSQRLSVIFSGAQRYVGGVGSLGLGWGWGALFVPMALRRRNHPASANTRA